MEIPKKKNKLYLPSLSANPRYAQFNVILPNVGKIVWKNV